ncbi:PilT/PilU family type 4a pilus ATPase [Pseudolysinimonas sp.]|uniref:PilT/PilU family type 4a pilus ATPase n=1 Tax=Pseudolysinimonas sp. TaxID=2680009 RepID=UPI00286AB550|nr:PilT/PilU family type 4a pilus ATPase [Pseudolysinimonas sp.]
MTDPANPPLGIPGAAGAMPPPRGVQPPVPPGSTTVDFSQLPPPAVATVDAAASAPALSSDAIPGYTPAPPVAMPGFTPAPAAPVLSVPDFTIIPPVNQRLERPSRGAFIPDDFTLAARARVDAELLTALETVVTEGASDLHVSIGAPPMIRIDGALRPIAGTDPWDRERVAAALYSLLTDEQQAQFDEVLELDFAFTLSEESRFRVNFYLQRGAIGGAFRLIPTEIKPLTALGIPEVVGEFGKLPRGLVLVTGPTGSGKSTTLAALIDLVNTTRSDHIVTVEDPIEFMHSNKRSLVNQREVGSDTQSFGNALKHVLRQDPDVILIGELRDLETISVALTAAETGHLVFATLHTQDASQTVDRVIDVFPPHQQGQVRTQLAATLQGVVCQTLVKRASGSGRAVATEVLVTTSAIANLIREGKTYQIRSALQAGRAQGMHTMDQHLADLVNSGAITYGAALEKVHDQEDFKRLVHRTGDNDPAGAAFASDFGARR